MKKLTLFPNTLFCIALILLSINVCHAQCYELRPASYPSLVLTEEGGLLKMRSPNNSANQIFKIVCNKSSYGYNSPNGAGCYSGSDVRIIPQGGVVPGEGFLYASGNSVVAYPLVWVDLDTQSWTMIDLENGLKGFIKRNSNTGFGSTYNWGAGSTDPNVTDLNLVPQADINVYGGNKWQLTSKTCPASSGNCEMNINLTSSVSNPAPGQNFTLTSSCSGGGCTGVQYEWAADGNESGIYGSTQTVSRPAGITQFAVIARKSGCTSQVAHLKVIIGGNGRTSAEFEHEEKLIAYPNPIVAQELNISLPSRSGKGETVKIYDINGNEVFTKELPEGVSESLNILLPNIPAGQYFLEYNQNGKSTKKQLRVE